MVSRAALAAALLLISLTVPAHAQSGDVARREHRAIAPVAPRPQIDSMKEPVERDASWPTARHAERKRAGQGWFPKNSVTDLNVEPDILPASEINYFLVKRDHPSEQPPDANAPTRLAAPSQSTPPGESTRENILSEFGDPNQDAPVAAAENAPKTMKPIFAALEIGDSDLAFQYVRRHVRYLRKLRERTTEIVSLTGVALEREGMLDHGATKTWEILPEHKALLAQMEEETKALEKERAEAMNLDARVKELFERADQSEAIAPADEKKPVSTLAKVTAARPKLSDDELRAAARENAARLPRSADGRVEVLFFLRLRDHNAQSMARALEKLHRRYIEDEKVKVTALMLDAETADTVRAFRRLTKASFDIKEGAKLAEALGVKSSPTTALVVPTTGKAHFEIGSREFAYLDELIGMMKGAVRGGTR